MKPYWLAREEGEAIWMFDALDTIKADADQTGGGLSAVEFLDFEGSSVPLHVNERWDRSFYILDGDYTFVVGEEAIVASLGTWLFVPRSTPHAWRCDSAQGRLLTIATPGGVEVFYRQVGEPVTDRGRLPGRTEPDVEALSRAAVQHGMRSSGHPPAPSTGCTSTRLEAQVVECQRDRHAPVRTTSGRGGTEHRLPFLYGDPLPLGSAPAARR